MNFHCLRIFWREKTYTRKPARRRDVVAPSLCRLGLFFKINPFWLTILCFVLVYRFKGKLRLAAQSMSTRVTRGCSANNVRVTFAFDGASPSGASLFT